MRIWGDMTGGIGYSSLSIRYIHLIAHIVTDVNIIEGV